MLQKTIGKHSLLFANYEHFKSSNLFFLDLMFFIFNSLDEFYRAANESVALNGAPSVNNLPVRTLDILLCQELLSHYKF
jgi:hypothetical protein